MHGSHEWQVCVRERERENIHNFAGANVLIQQNIQHPLQWNACLHHVFELLMEAAIVEKLGPTSGPTEKYFARFESYFNGLTKEEKEVIQTEAHGRIAFVSAEDAVTREFLEATKAFFANYGGSFQRGDYKEFARLVKVPEEGFLQKLMSLHVSLKLHVC